MTTVGFLVNPIAGMGGRVGLKGTDGVVDEARQRGAIPVAPERAAQAMQTIDAPILTCSGRMGAASIPGPADIVYTPPDQTTAADTRKACRRFIDEGADAIVFCGGDGTARDIYSITGDTVPILGIPAGVKMYSAVFALTPAAASDIIQRYLDGTATIAEREIMDIDERNVRAGRMKIRRYGIAPTLTAPALVQRGKQLHHVHNEAKYKQQIASFLSLVIRRGTCILGGGSTTAAVASALNVQGSILGVDVVTDGRLAAADAGEADILAVLDGRRANIVVSPIGRQGCVLGRGNQQISPRVIKKAGVENVIVAATPHKLAETPTLFVDTGDAALDEVLAGHRQVITGYAMAQRREVRCLTAPSARAAAT